jgi:hypothetical protein
MRQKFVIYPDRTKVRSEPSAMRRVVLVFVLAVTGTVGLHALYLQDDAGAEGSHLGDRPSRSANALAQVVPDAVPDAVPGAVPGAVANPIPVVPSTNSSHALTMDAAPATSGSMPTESGAASPGQLQIAETQGPENRERPASEQSPGKVAGKSPSPKQKAARHRSNGAGGPYAQYTYGAWAWYQRQPPSRFFRF